MRISIYIDRLPEELIDEFINWCIFEWAKPNLINRLLISPLKLDIDRLRAAESLQQLDVVISEMRQPLYETLVSFTELDIAELQQSPLKEEKDEMVRVDRLLSCFGTAVGLAINSPKVALPEESLQSKLRDMAFNCGIAASETRLDNDLKTEAKLQQLCEKYNVDVNKIIYL
jgi:hypothetical protein